MNFNDPKSTFVGNLPDPVRARAQMTGVGATLKASEMTGRMRSQRVIDAAPAKQAAFGAANGYPPCEPLYLDGKMIDRLTGKPWKQPATSPLAR